jgi:hypothetical protein
MVAAIFGSLDALGASRSDQAALEFGEAAENRQHQLPMRRRGLGPRITERFELGVGLIDR